MRSKLTLSAIAVIIILFSCRRDAIDAPKPQAGPKLKRIIVRDSTDKIIRSTFYNEWELFVTDSIFQKGSLAGWVHNEYNSKGKRTKSTTWAPVFNPAGYQGHHWKDTDEYMDDTLSVIFRHYLRDNLTLLTKHFYNSSRKLVLDSNFHTAVGATTSTRYIRAFTYDSQGRPLTITRLDDKNDSVTHTSYTYSANRMEEMTTNWTYIPVYRYSSLVVTEYTALGKVLSQKTYSPLTQLASQTDYTYDASGNLTKAVTTNLANTWEYRYTNNVITGKPEKMESYYQNKLSSTTFYYYE